MISYTLTLQETIALAEYSRGLLAKQQQPGSRDCRNHDQGLERIAQERIGKIAEFLCAHYIGGTVDLNVYRAGHTLVASFPVDRGDGPHAPTQ